MPNLWIVAVDLIAILTLTYAVYFRRHRRREMLLAYIGLNVGVLAVTTVLATSTVGAGLGLGLFGVLSIIRLRSSELAQEEVAYYFASLALGLIAGLQPDPVWVAPVFSGALVVVMFLVDSNPVHARYRRQVVTLDAVYADETQLTARLEDLLGARVRNVIVQEIDLVRDMQRVDVRYEVLPDAARTGERGGLRSVDARVGRAASAGAVRTSDATTAPNATTALDVTPAGVGQHR